MNQEAFNAHVIEQIRSTHALLKKMTNTDHCLQALCLALAEQPNLNAARLASAYEDNLQRIQEQVPPDLQDRQTFDLFAQALADRLKGMTG